MPTVTVQETQGHWSDFSSQESKVVTPASAIPVGDRAYFAHATTVDDGGSAPGESGYGGVQTLSDNVGNTWNRDVWTPPLDSQNDSTTAEIWSCDVEFEIPSDGSYRLIVEPDSRGLSTNWCFWSVSELAEAALDQIASQGHGAGENSNWPYTQFNVGPTGDTAQADEILFAVFSGWGTTISVPPSGWTLIDSYRGSAVGSLRSIAVYYKIVSEIDAYSVMLIGSTDQYAGASAIATYKVSGGGGGGPTPETTGEVFPTLGESVSESPWSDNTWSSPTNIYADDGSTAYVTASSFDSPDQTYVLKATGFDFSSIPDGSEIVGVKVRVNSWYRSGQGAGSIDLVQLLDTSKARTGDNKAGPTALNTTNTTVLTFGGSSDLWGCALTPAWLKNSNFGVGLGILATAANADVDVDYITIEVLYIPPEGNPGAFFPFL